MRTLTPQELEPGMIIADTLKTPTGQILALPGTEVTRQLINRMKLYRVATAEVEGTAATATDTPAAASVPKTFIEESKSPKQKIAESPQFQSFQIQYSRCIGLMCEIFTAAADNGTAIDTTMLLDSVSELFRSRNTIIELFDMLNNMHALNDSIYAHSLNVGLISRMIGRWLKLERHDLDVLTLAGLLHDIGKLRIPESILNKSESLTDEELALIRNHPRMGYDILRNQKLDPHIKKAALMHHERCDGSGYPSGLVEDLIDEYAMIVAIADVYDAMTAARIYRSPLCAFQVISQFEKDGYQKYPTKYILTFLKQIAATYQSNRVILSDGRGCKIVMLNPNDLSRPVVQFDDNTCLDLSANRTLSITTVV